MRLSVTPLKQNRILADEQTSARPQVALRLLGTTDLHAQLSGYDYFTDLPSHHGGLTRLSALIENARNERANVMLFDNGDALQGNPLADLHADLVTDHEHPVITAFNLLEYDAATLGNHEFNYGLEPLAQALSAAKFPVVCANVTRSDGRAFVPPWVILTRDVTDVDGKAYALKVGVIGLVPPQIMAWDRRHLLGKLTVTDMVEAAKAHLPDLRAAGADIVVGLCHTGFGALQQHVGMENAIHPLASLDFDAIFAGHTHKLHPTALEPDTAHKTPIAMAGFWGSHLAVIDLQLEKRAAGWAVLQGTSDLWSGEDVEGHETPVQFNLRRALAPAHARTLDHIRAQCGATEFPLQSYFSLVSDNACYQLLADAQMAYARVQLAYTENADLPLLCAVTPFKSGGPVGPQHYIDIPAGALALKHIADLYPYPNSLQIVRMTGAQILEWLERSAGLYRRIDSQSDVVDLIDATFPSYNFDMIKGLDYEIDPRAPARYGLLGDAVDPTAQRIKKLLHNGQALQLDQAFAVITNSYRASGGGGFPGLDGTQVIYESPMTNRDVVIDYVTSSGAISPMPTGNWRIAPLGGQKSRFRTAPGALGHLGDIDHFSPRHVGTDDDGFAILELTL